MEFVWILLVVAILALIGVNIRIVPQAHCFVIERLGEYRVTWNAGLHVKTPFIDRIAKRVSLKEQVLDFPPQPVITKDNVTMNIDSVVYAHVFDPVKYSYGVENALMGLQNLTATTLRSVIGDMELDQTLSSRAEINGRMQVILDEATDNWGLKVTRVEIKNIQPPKEIEEVMTKQMRAERERRQTILEAQAHKEAVVSRAEGDKQAKILEAEAERDAQRARAEGRAAAIEIISIAEAANLKRLSESGVNSAVLRLKAMDAMRDVADGQATKIFIPNDLAQSLSMTGMMGEMLGTAKGPDKDVKSRAQLRQDAAAAAAQAILNDDDCLKPGVTQETRSAAATTAKNAAVSALRAANPNATPSSPSGSIPASKYLGGNRN